MSPVAEMLYASGSTVAEVRESYPIELLVFKKRKGWTKR